MNNLLAVRSLLVTMATDSIRNKQYDHTGIMAGDISGTHVTSTPDFESSDVTSGKTRGREEENTILGSLFTWLNRSDPFVSHAPGNQTQKETASSEPGFGAEHHNIVYNASDPLWPTAMSNVSASRPSSLRPEPAPTWFTSLADHSELHLNTTSMDQTFSWPSSPWPNWTLPPSGSPKELLNASHPSVSFTFDPVFSTSSRDGASTLSAVNDSASELAVKVAALGIVCLLGTIGNVMLIWTVVKERHLHRPPFYFLLSLGLTDLSRSAFCVPVVISTVLQGSTWRHGDSACKLFAFATSFFVFSSALTLLAIAVDRHISVVYAKTYRRRCHGLINLAVAVIVWIIAFSVSFPPVLGVGDYVFMPAEAQCAFHHRHFRHNDAAGSVLVFLAIAFLTYFLYFRIFSFMRAHRRMRPLQHHQPALSSNWAFVGPGANGQAFINWLNGFGGQARNRAAGQRTVQRLNFGRVVNLSTARNEHLTRLFLILTVVFSVCWTPYTVTSLWRVFWDVASLPVLFVTVSAWLGYAQVSLCPIAYFLFRGKMKRPSRTICAESEKKEFLLENKIRK